MQQHTSFSPTRHYVGEKNAESLKRRNELEPKQVQLSNGEELKRFYVVLLLTVLVEMPLRVCATPYK